MTNTIAFQPVTVTRTQLVAATRAYVSVGYSYRDSYISRKEGAIEPQESHTDCVRLLLHIAKDVGLLPADFDVNRPRPHEPGERPLPRDEWMLQLLQENCDRLWQWSDFANAEAIRMEAGTVLLFQWPDTRYHVAIKTDTEPLPYGRMVEARDIDGVVETNIMADDWACLESAWSIRVLRE